MTVNTPVKDGGASWALWVSWLVLFGVALLCLSIFIQGVMRDTRWGEPVIAVNFGEAGAWQSGPVRGWGSKGYRLSLASVNHDPRLVGRPLRADFRVRVTGGDGQVVVDRLYEGENLNHAAPDNYADTQLDRVSLESRPWNPGSLAVRVVNPDPGFGPVPSRLRLYSDRPDTGMGGLINYAMLLPGGMGLVLSLLLSARIAARGTKWPLFLNLAVLLAAALLIGRG